MSRPVGSNPTAPVMNNTQICPECGVVASLKDEPVQFNDFAGTFPVRQLRYQCDCGWSFTDEEQREQNHAFHRQARTNRAWELRDKGISFWSQIRK
jgi:hypothetical protein